MDDSFARRTSMQ